MDVLPLSLKLWIMTHTKAQIKTYKRELSENDTSSEASSEDDQERTLDSPSSPSTVKEVTLSGNKTPVVEVTAPPPQGGAIGISAGNKPPTLVATSPLEGATAKNLVEGVMHNGGLSHGNYDKGPDYAVPMRDMKITTIPSKRAVLVSAESDDGIGHENSAARNESSEDRRDSVYDEGNLSYSGAGYATIDEYTSPPQPSHQATDISHLPEDVQALLNGLQEGPTISDLDSGFHGSVVALSHNKPHAPTNVSSRSPGDMGEPYHVKTPSFEGKSYFTEKVIPHQGSEVQHAQITDVKAVAQKAGGARLVREQGVGSYHGDGKETSVQAPVTMATTTKSHEPGITMATQTLPEPQEAKIEIITMRNVYQGPQTSWSSKSKKKASPEQESPSTSVSMTTRSPISTETKPMAAPAVPAHSNVAVTSHTPVQIRDPTTSVPDPTAEPQDPMDPYYDDMDDQIDSETIQNVEEQIRHTQQHLQFLQEQQEKLKKRQMDRTKLREMTLKRNSSAFEKHSQGYQFSAAVSSTLPRQPNHNGGFAMSGSATLQHPSRNEMPPVTNVNQGIVGGAPVQQNQSQDPWEPHGRPLGRRVSDTSHDRQRPARLAKASTVDTEPQKQANNDIIMTSDLQEQLAELDRCIAQLTTSMDITDVPDSAPQQTVIHRHRSCTDSGSLTDTKNFPVPRPPARSRSSFDSYKRLSQELDVSIKRTISDADGNDDVFSPVSPRPKQSPFPPQTSVTRRQHVAPAPPPKRRMSLEERLSPSLLQTLALNPGAKPKENIHSYKEDLAPNDAPATPSFPTTPTTPYVNNDSPVRAKSPPGLMKTPLSMLHLKPTESPTESLHHHKEQEKGSPTSGEAMQNGHVKETALLNDEGTRRAQRLEARNAGSNQVPEEHLRKNVHNNHVGYPGQVSPHEVVHTNVISVQRDIQTSRSNERQMHPVQTHMLHSGIQPMHSTPQQHSPPISPQQNLPPQYHHNHSGTSHSSHSPAATSSNSRHGSSDSLDGPSTRHSNSSLLSSSSSASSPHAVVGGMISPNNMMRPGSQISSYDRNTHLQGTRSGDESLGSPQSGRTSSSSISDVERLNHEMSHAHVSAAPKFIRDTTSYWYKPDISRDHALALLRDKPPGCFVVRDSRCFPGAFGLALKVDKLPPTVQAKPGVDVANEYVRHFLIEPSSRGVKLKGCPNEPVFGSLSALVYQHSITPLALPCKLIIPTSDLELTSAPNSARNSQHEVAANSAAELLRQGAACNVVYIGSVDTESLTGPQAIERAIRETYRTAQADPSRTSIVHFKVSPQGITLTDNARKLFFRRHYPTTTVTYCGMDSMGNQSKGQKQRRWDASAIHGSPDAWMFGFVARKQAGSSDNMCHVFAELDSAQPARAIVNFVTKVLIGSARQNQP